MSEDKATSVATDVVERIEPLIHTLPKGQQAELRQIIATSFQGPLPPPQMLAEYDRIIPNGAERLLVLLEKQTDHRISMESQIVNSRVKITGGGQRIAAFLSAFFGLITLLLGYSGHDVLAGSIGVTTIIGLAVIFALGKQPSGAAKEDLPTSSAKNSPPTAKRKRGS